MSDFADLADAGRRLGPALAEAVARRLLADLPGE